MFTFLDMTNSQFGFKASSIGPKGDCPQERHLLRLCYEL